MDVQRLSLFVYENSAERVMFNKEEYTCAYVEQLMEENEQLRAELIRVVEENESVKRESSQLKRILRQRNALDEEADDSCDETASPPLRSSVQRTSFSVEDEQVLTKRLEVKTSENLELTERLGQLRTERDGLASELERVRTENVRLAKDLRTSELRIVRLTKEEEEGFRLRMENSEQRDRIAQVESQRRESLILNEELESELERKKEEIADLKDKLDEKENWYREYRTLLEEQKATNASLRHEQRPRVLRHISSPNSPYVSQQSFASEIEESIRVKRKQRRYSENALESCRVRNMISLVHMTSASSVRRRIFSESRSPLHAAPIGDNRLDQSISEPELWLGSGSTVGSSSTAEEEEEERGTDRGHPAADDHDASAFEGLHARKGICFVPLGCPGRPGSLDLEFALGLRVHLSPLQTGQLAELFEFDDEETESRVDEEETSSSRCETPRRSSNASGYSTQSHQVEKLHLVKPIEGSLTLLQWRRLAMPGLGNILESRDGIQVKGNDLESQFEQERHTLSDYEEDDDDDDTADDDCGFNGVLNADTGPTKNSTPSEKVKSSQKSQSSKRKSEKSKHAQDMEMFILLNTTRVPLSTLVGLDESTDPSKNSRKRPGCIVS